MSLIGSIDGSEMGDSACLTTHPTFDDKPNLALIPLVRPKTSFSLKFMYWEEGNMSLVESLEMLELSDMRHFSKLIYKTFSVYV